MREWRQLLTLLGDRIRPPTSPLGITLGSCSPVAPSGVPSGRSVFSGSASARSSGGTSLSFNASSPAAAADFAAAAVAAAAAAFAAAALSFVAASTSSAAAAAATS